MKNESIMILKSHKKAKYSAMYNVNVNSTQTIIFVAWESGRSRDQRVKEKQHVIRPVIWCSAWVHSLGIIVWCAQTWPRWENRGREISSSCFCHLQLILSCPPPLSSSSSSSPTAHRIWPGPSFCFPRRCFLDRAIRPCQSAHSPPRTAFSLPSLFRCLRLSRFPSSICSCGALWVDPLCKKFILVLKTDCVCFHRASPFCLVWEQACVKTLSKSVSPLILYVCRNVDFSTNILSWILI